ncbi:MAG: hypothetical protein GC162_17940 [Planctomycetes bacterium]|nr:hypothetical protein [Planctomycetota bacterium]
MTAADWFAVFDTSAIFQDVCHYQLSRQSTIHEYEDVSADDFPDCDRSRESYQRMYHARIPADAWRQLHRKPRKTTIGEVCDFLAACGGVMPEPRPLFIMGRGCMPAGVFLTLRSLLREHGADVSDLRPSTPINQFAMAQWRPFIEMLWHFRPELTRRVKKIEVPGGLIFAWMFLAGLATLIISYVGIWFGLSAYGFAVAGGLLISGLIGMSAMSTRPPRDIQFEGAATFADLCRLIA